VLFRSPKKNLKYPRFNALAVFSESGNSVLTAKSSDLIYGANVESQVTLKTVDFPYNDPSIAGQPKQNVAEIEQLVRNSVSELIGGNTLISPVAYFDDSRFSLKEASFVTAPGITITAENVSTPVKIDPDEYIGKRYQERTVPIRSAAMLAEILQTEGMDEAEATLIENVVSADLGSTRLKAGDQLKIFFEVERFSPEETKSRIAKMSVFRSNTHLVSIARTDDDRFVYAKPPEIRQTKNSNATKRKTVSRSRLPSAYDGIYRAALSEGLTPDLAGILIKIFAFDVDFKTRIGPADDLNVFVSLEDGLDHPTAESEILYTSINLNGLKRKYYRFRDAKTGRVDYYDETGKSAKKFLLRQPVPYGKFRSPFGMRRHPVYRYRRMHSGVDWSAPRGTKILAAGNGVIEKAGWHSGGYGKQTIIRHANGYKTSYSHQSRIAKGVVPGARVRQGQVIGAVGSTGLSTGPHLHYEVIVNGNKVNPMRIRLPKGKVLKDAELASFEAERDRIDALLADRNRATTVAAL